MFSFFGVFYGTLINIYIYKGKGGKKMYNATVITVSDKGSLGQREDLSGKEIGGGTPVGTDFPERYEHLRLGHRQ